MYITTITPELIPVAAEWFCQKWGIPASIYRGSMLSALENTAEIPRWYLAMEEKEIVGGLGVIVNDFHDRPDLTPNICAVYVEPAYRNKGIAGKLLEYACGDMRAMGVATLYLLTDHIGFYERYGWEYLCDAAGSDGNRSRLYIHKEAPMTFEERKAQVAYYLGKTVDICIDRPIGYVHEKGSYSLVYPINYGYIPNVLGGDGEELDVYVLGIDEPIEAAKVKIIGIVHRENDVEDKLIGAPEGKSFTASEMAEAVSFQEKYYISHIEDQKSN